MDLFRLREMIRFWAPLIGLVFAAYYAYDYYYVFEQDPGSALAAKKNQITEIKNQNIILDKKVKKLEEFIRQVESKKEEVRSIAQQLAESREVLSDNVQISEFMKMLISEAKRAGLSILSIIPSSKIQQEYYAVVPVEVKFHGVYAQIFTFMNRLANLQRIVRVDRFSMKPVSAASKKYVELEGSLEIKTFAYIGSQADQIGKGSP